jgi:hypothetical protein
VTVGPASHRVVALHNILPKLTVKVALTQRKVNRFDYCANFALENREVRSDRHINNIQMMMTNNDRLVQHEYFRQMTQNASVRSDGERR